MRSRRLAVAALLAAGLGPLAAPAAHAQPAYPPPITPVVRTVDRCVQVLVDGKPHNGPLPRNQQMQVKGLDKCARALERGLEALMRSQTFHLATFDAQGDGSYLSPVFRVPNATPGSHLLIVRTRDSELARSVQITIPAEVLGTSTTRDGELPLSGAQIVLLVLIALTLVATGLLLRRVVRYRSLAFAGVRRRKTPLMLPEPDVPFVDTSHFMPFRPPRATDARDPDGPAS